MVHSVVFLQAQHSALVVAFELLYDCRSQFISVQVRLVLTCCDLKAQLQQLGVIHRGRCILFKCSIVKINTEILNASGEKFQEHSSGSSTTDIFSCCFQHILAKAKCHFPFFFSAENCKQKQHLIYSEPLKTMTALDDVVSLFALYN